MEKYLCHISTDAIASFDIDSYSSMILEAPNLQPRKKCQNERLREYDSILTHGNTLTYLRNNRSPNFFIIEKFISKIFILGGRP